MTISLETTTGSLPVHEIAKAAAVMRTLDEVREFFGNTSSPLTIRCEQCGAEVAKVCISPDGKSLESFHDGRRDRHISPDTLYLAYLFEADVNTGIQARELVVVRPSDWDDDLFVPVMRLSDQTAPPGVLLRSSVSVIGPLGTTEIEAVELWSILFAKSA